jgi:hypothetical protein
MHMHTSTSTYTIFTYSEIEHYLKAPYPPVSGPWDVTTSRCKLQQLEHFITNGIGHLPGKREGRKKEKKKCICILTHTQNRDATYIRAQTDTQTNTCAYAYTHRQTHRILTPRRL